MAIDLTPRWNDFAVYQIGIGTFPGTQHIKREKTADGVVRAWTECGDSNVLSLSHIVSEAPQTAQIQREAAITPQLGQSQAQTQKTAQIQPSQVQKQRKRQVSTAPIADPIKHQIVQNRLTKQLMRQSNIVKPTVDDIEIAKSRAETAQKRVDLEFKKQAEEQLRKHVREKRRRLAKPNDA